MASAGNSNQQQPGLYRPPNPNTLAPASSSSYPPPFSYQAQPHYMNINLPYPQPPDHPYQRSISFPTPPLQSQSQSQSQPPLPSNQHNHGARLMALLGTNQIPIPIPIPSPPPSLTPTPSSNLDPSLSWSSSVPTPNPQLLHLIPSAPPAAAPAPLRLLSTKLPRGRRLTADHAVYDVDVRNLGEFQPQLEVTPITKYISDPSLVLGRQIAVNKSYICYGLKLGAIRVLNINTALRALLKGHTQRVTDMAFFAEDVHLLASASIDGRVFVWKINEGIDEEDKPLISGKVVIALQMMGEGESIHPRICWHSHKQEFLVVGIGKRVLKIDTTKVGRGDVYSAEEPLKCSLESLIDGVQLVGKHDGEVTDLSMCQWMTTRLVSASSDGVVKIWEDRKAIPLATLRPHDGQPVNSAKFLTAPHSPEHIILVTAGPLNREVKIWASASEEGWLLPSDADSWKCTQTLELKSSESGAEEAFFNQVVALPHAGLILLANAKKNAIYAVHLEYGSCPAATRMDYIAEFTVTMPILSLTGTSDTLPDGNHIIQVYCVQTQAIQQYALDLSQCLPPPLENMGLEKADSTGSRAFESPNSNVPAILEASQGSIPTELPVGSATFKLHRVSSSESAPLARYPIISGPSEVPSLHGLSSTETKQYVLPLTTSDADNTDNTRVGSPSIPLSPRLSRKSSGFRSPNTFELSSPQGIRAVDQSVLNYSADGRGESGPTNFPDISSYDDNSRKGGNKILQNDISMVASAPFKQPTHLITPAEILSMAVSSSDNTQGMKWSESKVQDSFLNNDVENVEKDKVVVDNATKHHEFESQKESGILYMEKKEKSFYSQASDLNMEMARECCAFSTEPLSIEASKVDNSGVMEAFDKPSNVGEEEFQDSCKDVPAKSSESASIAALNPVQVTEAKGISSQISGSSSASSGPFNSTGSFDEPSDSIAVDCEEASFSHIQALQESLNQLIAMQNEMQKQMPTVVSGPVTKECKRIEAALGRNMEKAIKANSDALWARLQEENMKHEKLERERTQQMMNSVTNLMNKELPSMLERTLKKELAAIGQVVARLVTPAVEKSISSAITESFQRGVGEKAVNQLEKSVSSKLETAVARQIQAQFQNSGKQALQDVLKSTLEASVIPAFEKSCQTMFEQVDATFQNGMIEHTFAAQQQLDSAQGSLALSLKDALNSATSITRTLSGELADGQRKLLALATAGTNSKTANTLAPHMSNGPLGTLHEMVEVPSDPTKELSRLISELKFEEAFTGALQRSDVSIVSWLCSQVDLQRVLSMVPLPLGQGVLLALLQQLACDISTETALKLTWMTDVAVVINPADPMIAMHIRPIFEQVYQILGHQRTLPTTTAAEATSIRLLMHVINSMLTSCK